MLFAPRLRSDLPWPRFRPQAPAISCPAGGEPRLKRNRAPAQRDAFIETPETPQLSRCSRARTHGQPPFLAVTVLSVSLGWHWVIATMPMLTWTGIGGVCAEQQLFQPSFAPESKPTGMPCSTQPCHSRMDGFHAFRGVFVANCATKERGSPPAFGLVVALVGVRSRQVQSVCQVNSCARADEMCCNITSYVSIPKPGAATMHAKTDQTALDVRRPAQLRRWSRSPHTIAKVEKPLPTPTAPTAQSTGQTLFWLTQQQSPTTSGIVVVGTAEQTAGNRLSVMAISLNRLRLRACWHEELGAGMCCILKFLPPFAFPLQLSSSTIHGPHSWVSRRWLLARCGPTTIRSETVITCTPMLATKDRHRF